MPPVGGRARRRDNSVLAVAVQLARDNTHAPLLKRVAVVSAPVVDQNKEPIAERFNLNVSKALMDAKTLAARYHVGVLSGGGAPFRFVSGGEMAKALSAIRKRK